MEPEALSEAVRTTADTTMRRRRGVIGLSLAAAGSMSVIALYQSGVIRHIPEPALPVLNADRVDASAEAFERFQVGDAFLGFVSYGITMTLAAMGPPHRAAEQPWLPLALAGKVAFDVATAAKLTVDQWTRHKAFCFWCLLAAASTFATAPLVVHEAREALSVLGGRSGAPSLAGAAPALR